MIDKRIRAIYYIMLNLNSKVIKNNDDLAYYYTAGLCLRYEHTKGKGHQDPVDVMVGKLAFDKKWFDWIDK